MLEYSRGDWMKIQKMIFSGICLFLAVYLFYVNVGLNISGPAHLNENAIVQVQQKIQKRFPAIQQIERHSFKYITYSAVVNDKAYFFDHEGGLIVEKMYNEEQKEKVKEIALSKGFENPTIKLGYGYINPVFIIEEKEGFLYLDYDTLEIIFYMKGEEYERMV